MMSVLQGCEPSSPVVPQIPVLRLIHASRNTVNPLKHYRVEVTNVQGLYY